MQRPRSLTEDEAGAGAGAALKPPHPKCCLAAPPVLEFNAEGKLLRSWGGPGAGYDWPGNEHGAHADAKGFVWITGNGENDGQILKFSADGRFVLQIGKQTNSNDITRLGRPAGVEEAVAPGRRPQQPGADARPRDRRGRGNAGAIRPVCGRVSLGARPGDRFAREPVCGGGGYGEEGAEVCEAVRAEGGGSRKAVTAIGHEPTVVTGSFMATRVDGAAPEAMTKCSSDPGSVAAGIVQL